MSPQPADAAATADAAAAGVADSTRSGTRSPGRRVGSVRAFALCYRVLMRQIVSTGRLVALAVLGSVMIVVGWVIGRSAAGQGRAAESMLSDAADYADGFGLIVIVPIVSLVFAAASLGDIRDDGTLVYLWLRPIGRAPLAAAAAAAAVTVSLPLCVTPTVLGGWLGSGRVAGSPELAAGAFAAAAAGTVAYSCLFVLAGLLFRKAVLWGIGYVLLWEGLAVALGEFAARLSLRGYTRSILARVADLDPRLANDSLEVAVIVLACVSVAALALTAFGLRRVDVA